MNELFLVFISYWDFSLTMYIDFFLQMLALNYAKIKIYSFFLIFPHSKGEGDFVYLEVKWPC